MLRLRSIILRLLATFLLFVGIGGAFALNIPDKPDSRVIDQTNTLTSLQKQALVEKLDNIYNTESHTEIQVLMIASLDNEPIEDVSIGVARKWQIGQKNANNGAIILVAVRDHKYRIEVGYGLEGVLPDGYIGNLERNIMTPYFAKNDFFNGLNLAIEDLGREISKDYKTAPVVNGQQLPIKNAVTYVLLGVVFFVIIAAFASLSGKPGKVKDVLWFILKIITLASLFRGGSGNNRNNDDDIGGGGDFGGGGSSNKW